MLFFIHARREAFSPVFGGVFCFWWLTIRFFDSQLNWLLTFSISLYGTVSCSCAVCYGLVLFSAFFTTRSFPIACTD